MSRIGMGGSGGGAAAGGVASVLAGHRIADGGTPTYAPLPGHTIVSRNQTFGLTANRLYSIPFEVTEDWTPGTFAIQVTASAAGGARFGIYDADVDLQPTDLVLDVTGGSPLDVSSTGIKTVTGLTTTFPPGLYVAQLISDAAPTLRSNLSGISWINPASFGELASSFAKSAQTYQAFPATGITWDTATYAAGGNGLQLPIFWQGA